MFLHATSVAKKEHVIYLLLVLTLQLLLLNDEPYLELLHLLSQLLVFLFDFSAWPPSPFFPPPIGGL